MVAFKLLTTQMLQRHQVKVHYDPDAVIRRSDANIVLIENEWERALAQAAVRGTPMFNGPLYRLIDYTAASDGLQLSLGPTDYKDYVGTRSEIFTRTNSYDSLANPMAVCIAIVTSDGQIVIEQRGIVDVYSGRSHVIGGFFDRRMDSSLDESPDPFAAIQREVNEEVGLMVASSEIRLSGLVYDLETPHPELCFFVHVDETFADILHSYSSVNTEDKALQLVPLPATPDALSSFITATHDTLSVTGEACLVLFGLHTYGMEWLDDIMSAIG